MLAYNIVNSYSNLGGVKFATSKITLLNGGMFFKSLLMDHEYGSEANPYVHGGQYG